MALIANTSRYVETLTPGNVPLPMESRYELAFDRRHVKSPQPMRDR